MKNSKRTLNLILAVSLFVTAILHSCLSGAYVRSAPHDQFTYWIGLWSTTIPFAFWAVVTFLVTWMRREPPDKLRSTICGYMAGWSAMTALTLWIVSWPRGPETSSTMAIAVFLTPFLFVPLFPIAYLLVSWIASRFWPAQSEPLPD